MQELTKGMETDLGISWCFSNPGSVAVKFRGYSVKVDFQSKKTGKLWVYCPYIKDK